MSKIDLPSRRQMENPIREKNRAEARGNNNHEQDEEKDHNHGQK